MEISRYQALADAASSVKSWGWSSDACEVVLSSISFQKASRSGVDKCGWKRSRFSPFVRVELAATWEGVAAAGEDFSGNDIASIFVT
jgi:hypothetical protein